MRCCHETPRTLERTFILALVARNRVLALVLVVLAATVCPTLAQQRDPGGPAISVQALCYQGLKQFDPPEWNQNWNSPEAEVSTSWVGPGCHAEVRIDYEWRFKTTLDGNWVYQQSAVNLDVLEYMPSLGSDFEIFRWSHDVIHGVLHNTTSTWGAAYVYWHLRYIVYARIIRDMDGAVLAQGMFETPDYIWERYTPVFRPWYGLPIGIE